MIAGASRDDEMAAASAGPVALDAANASLPPTGIFTADFAYACYYLLVTRIAHHAAAA